jgi:hypothetical protein
VPSKTTKAILLAVVIVAVWLAPSTLMRPVYCTSAAVYGAGGMKKSAVLTALPCDVATEIRPEPV